MALNMDLALRCYFKYRQKKIEQVFADPISYQKRTLSKILDRNASCEYGRKYKFSKIKTYEGFKKSLPIIRYEDIFSEVERMLDAAPNVLTSEKVTWFAKSSGTTNDRSKYIPVTKNYMVNGHLKCTWTTVSSVYNEDPKAKLFHNKSVVMGGSLNELPNGLKTGDVSAILLRNFPPIGKRFYCPDFETALMDDWDLKIKLIASKAIKEPITMMAGVPTWTIVLIKEILRQTGQTDLSKVWPTLRTYLHGGVGFEPYQSTFNQYISNPEMSYREIYNASEGYFAMQNEKAEDAMILLCDHEIFYEFIPVSDVDNPHETIVPLEDVQINKKYAMVITNSSGLYRYIIGDIVEFISIRPYKIKVRGRLQQHINVFGEELMIGNAEAALGQVCSRHSAEIKDFTAGPVFMNSESKGGHEWLIEFENAPDSLKDFSQDLDSVLRQLNSDYDAKRSDDMAMTSPKLTALSHGTFEKWLRSKNKYGGQSKVPRLSNQRQYIEALLEIEMKKGLTSDRT